MSYSIQNVLKKAANLIKKIELYIIKHETEIGSEELEQVFLGEDQYRAAYLTVLNVRAKEVVEYAKSKNIDLTVEQVRENPFIIAYDLSQKCNWKMTK